MLGYCTTPALASKNLNNNQIVLRIHLFIKLVKYICISLNCLHDTFKPMKECAIKNQTASPFRRTRGARGSLAKDAAVYDRPLCAVWAGQQFNQKIKVYTHLHSAYYISAFCFSFPNKSCLEISWTSSDQVITLHYLTTKSPKGVIMIFIINLWNQSFYKW